MYHLLPLCRSLASLTCVCASARLGLPVSRPVLAACEKELWQKCPFGPKDDGDVASCCDVMFRGFSSVLMKYKFKASYYFFFPKKTPHLVWPNPCLLYTSDAADDPRVV